MIDVKFVAKLYSKGTEIFKIFEFLYVNIYRNNMFYLLVVCVCNSGDFKYLIVF